jgi:uncharacterized protein YcfL
MIANNLRAKFGGFVISVSLFSLVGCASAPTATVNDVLMFRPNCKIAEQQLAFLYNIRPERHDLNLKLAVEQKIGEVEYKCSK